MEQIVSKHWDSEVVLSLIAKRMGVTHYLPCHVRMMNALLIFHDGYHVR